MRVSLPPARTPSILPSAPHVRNGVVHLHGGELRDVQRNRVVVTDEALVGGERGGKGKGGREKRGDSEAE